MEIICLFFIILLMNNFLISRCTHNVILRYVSSPYHGSRSPVSKRTTSELATTMDLLPTLANLADVPLHGNTIDGHNILSLLHNENAKSPEDRFYYYQSEQLQAVRYKKWKLHLSLDSIYDNPYLGTFTYDRLMALYNFKRDREE